MDKIKYTMFIKSISYKISCLVLLITLITSCTQNNDIERKIKQQIKDCKDDSCRVSIRQLTNFKWDKMYVFNNPTAPGDIDQVIGLRYPYYVEFTRTIVFLDKDKIVHYENHHSKAEGPTDGEVLFGYPDSLKFQVYKPDQSIFRAKRKTFKDGTYFILDQ